MAPARPICSRPCRCSRKGGACAARKSPTWRAQGGAGGFAVSLELLGEAGGPVQMGAGLERIEGVAQRKFRLDREPIGSAARLRRPRPHRLADARHGRPVHRSRRRAPPFSRPPGAGGGQRAWRPRQRPRTGAAQPQPPAGRALFARKSGSTPPSARSPNWPSPWPAARREPCQRLAALIAAASDEASPFPWADIALEGEIDRLVAENPALAAEDRYRAMLRDNRARDARRRPHADRPAGERPRACATAPKPARRARASTGEQKALLVGLVLAHARLVAAMSGIAPLVLLDEIAAHFDPVRRRALFDALDALGGQIWMTGADTALFEDLIGPRRPVRRGQRRQLPLSRAERRMSDLADGPTPAEKSLRLRRFPPRPGRDHRRRAGGRAGAGGDADRLRQKSMCYQLPALMSDGLTLVVSPLIALMRDQVGQMRALGVCRRHAQFAKQRGEVGETWRQIRDGDAAAAVRVAGAPRRWTG